jgi:hypothetical protein
VGGRGCDQIGLGAVVVLLRAARHPGTRRDRSRGQARIALFGQDIDRRIEHALLGGAAALLLGLARFGGLRRCLAFSDHSLSSVGATDNAGEQFEIHWMTLAACPILGQALHGPDRRVRDCNVIELATSL